jgi:RimJ/RimL family protein N-acetyltransferase
MRRDADVVLRPWSEEDAAGVREAIDEDVGHLKPWLSWTLDEPVSLDRTRARLADYVEQFRTGRAYRYAITRADGPSSILGGVSLNQRVGPCAHDVGYWIRRSATRQGVAGAAVCALAIRAFEGRGIHRLVIQCDVANIVSAAFARRLGFEPVGAAEARHADGSPRPVLQFEMLLESYRQQHQAAFHVRARRVVLNG